MTPATTDSRGIALASTDTRGVTLATTDQRGVALAGTDHRGVTLAGTDGSPSVSPYLPYLHSTVANVAVPPPARHDDPQLSTAAHTDMLLLNLMRINGLTPKCPRSTKHGEVVSLNLILCVINGLEHKLTLLKIKGSE